MSEIAVIKTGGKQYKVAEGDVIKVEKLEKADKLEFDDLLGGKKVTATLVGDGRHPKVRVLKFHPKKRYKRVNGHIQGFTEIKIESIK
jgi:large subunit ribosomal protein L21